MSNDLIYYTLFPWENAYSSVSLSFTREFAKGNRVFYVNPPYTLKDLWSRRHEPLTQARRADMLAGRVRYERIPNMPDRVIGVQPPVVLPINFLPKGKLYDALHRRNSEVVFKAVEQVVEKYRLRDYIYLNCFNPFHGAVLPRPRFRPLLNVYQCIDDMYEEHYTAKHAAGIEERMMAAADVTLVTSRNLKKLKGVHNPNTHVLHNAMEPKFFRKAIDETLPRPPELANVTGKIIGFTGNINGYRQDYDLWRKIAVHHADKTLCMVGPLNSDDYRRVGLDQLPNVILTGGKDISELPAYLQHFDVTVIPFLKNRLTASVYPLKINEYLAAGKPAVCTNFSEDIQSFRRDVYLAESHDEFLQLIDRAIAEDSAEKRASRIETAYSNTWTDRVREFWEIVETALEHQPQPA